MRWLPCGRATGMVKAAHCAALHQVCMCCWLPRHCTRAIGAPGVPGRLFVVSARSTLLRVACAVGRHGPASVRTRRVAEVFSVRASCTECRMRLPPFACAGIPAHSGVNAVRITLSEVLRATCRSSDQGPHIALCRLYEGDGFSGCDPVLLFATGMVAAPSLLAASLVACVPVGWARGSSGARRCCLAGGASACMLFAHICCFADWALQVSNSLMGGASSSGMLDMHTSQSFAIGVIIRSFMHQQLLVMGFKDAAESATNATQGGCFATCAWRCGGKRQSARCCCTHQLTAAVYGLCGHECCATEWVA